MSAPPTDTAGTTRAAPTTDPEPPATEPPGTVAEPPSTEPAPAPTEPEPQIAEMRMAIVENLGDAGGGTLQPLASAPLPEGYTEAEFSFTGDAMSYETVGERGTDGMWSAAETGMVAPFTSRLIVRTPPADRFSGTVLVEWNNVTAGTDTTPDWGFLHEMIGREGHAYVAVSAQSVGVMGAEDAFIGGDLIDTSGLAERDPARYGEMFHPGDEFAYDIFTQAGTALAEDGVLAGLEPTHVVALGESQSAFFLTGYVNAIHPLVQLYDGFLIHSRGGTAVAPDGTRGDEAGPEFVHVRTDLDVPVLQYATETDFFGLGFAAARQPDSDSVRTWEVAGTAHADAYSLFASGLPRDASSGDILGCASPINDGPQHETLAAAVHHLVAWVVDGTPPPESPLLDTVDDGFARDELGIALGGIRTPVVDAPLRILSGDPGPDVGSCFLFGQTIPLDQAVLDSLYRGSLATWSGAAVRSADGAVDAGWLLADDAATMLAESTERAMALGLS